MVVKDTPHLMTADEFEEFLALPENADRNFELIHGKMVEKVASQEHGRTTGIIFGWIFIFLQQNPIGHGEIEVRHRMPDDPHNSRQPDLSVTLDTVTPPVKRGAVLKMPDLAVEVKSPTNTYLEQREKAAYYIQNGSRMVWLVFPEKRLVEVYRPGMDVEILDINDTLTGYDVLPGFALPVKTIFGLK